MSNKRAFALGAVAMVGVYLGAKVVLNVACHRIMRRLPKVGVIITEVPEDKADDCEKKAEKEES